jgi:AraC-type DNA-binding domain-containing proteins
MRFLIPALVDETENVESPTVTELQPTEEDRELFWGNEQKLRAVLEQWVKEKNYCRGDVSVDDIVKALGTDNNFFRYYFREIMQTDFRTWRAGLRIAEAQRLMTDNPDVTLDQLAKTTGLISIASFKRLPEKLPPIIKSGCRNSLFPLFFVFFVAFCCFNEKQQKYFFEAIFLVYFCLLYTLSTTKGKAVRKIVRE